MQSVAAAFDFSFLGMPAIAVVIDLPFRNILLPKLFIVSHFCLQYDVGRFGIPYCLVRGVCFVRLAWLFIGIGMDITHVYGDQTR